MRVSQERIGINLAKPINMENSNDTCFGNEWSATAPECRQCGLYDLCCTVYNKTKVKQKRASVKKQGTLDTFDFDAINRKSLATILKEQPTSYEELMVYVASTSKCTIPHLVTSWIRLFMEEYNLKIENNLISSN
jgi:hypothetical protein